MNLLVFVTADTLKVKENSPDISSFNGLGRKNAFLGIAMTIAMLALIGLPPTGGFTAKFVILTGMFEWYGIEADPLRLTLFVLAVINVVVSLFYYLKLPFAMFFRDTDSTFSTSALHYLLIAISGIILIASFIFFSGFGEMIQYLAGDIIR
jgi:NADH-quinone oxidoreductase subunit N